MKNVLVTGAGSSIGKHLIKKLLQTNGVEFLANLYHYTSSYMPNYSCESNKLIYNYQGDPITDGRLYDILARYNIDTVFHLAGKSTNNYDEGNIFESNVALTHQLIRNCPIGIRFVFTSSLVVYGNGKERELSEEEDELKPTSYYGLSKVMCEQLINFATQQKRISGINLRLCANVGEGFSHGLLPDLIKKAKDPSINMELITNTYKPFMYVGDTADTLIKFGQSNHVGDFNLCPDDGISVENVAKKVLDKLVINKDIKWNSENAILGDNTLITAANKKIKNTGLFPSQIASSEQIDKALNEILGESNGKG